MVKEKHIKGQNIMIRFIATELTEVPGSYVAKDEMMAIFQRYATRKGLQLMTQTKISTLLKKLCPYISSGRRSVNKIPVSCWWNVSPTKKEELSILKKINKERISYDKIKPIPDFKFVLKSKEEIDKDIDIARIRVGMKPLSRYREVVSYTEHLKRQEDREINKLLAKNNKRLSEMLGITVKNNSIFVENEYKDRDFILKTIQVFLTISNTEK